MDRKNMIQKTMDVLFYLSDHAKGVTMTEIAEALRFPKATVFDILKTLMGGDFVEYVNPKKKLYGIGSQAYILGMSYLDASNLFIISKPYLVLLADKYEKTTFISKRRHDRAIFVYKYASPYARVSTGNIGDRKMLHSTAVGKCYLAFDVAAVFLIDTIEMVPFTRHTITSREQLKKQIEQIRGLGYAYEVEESHERMACIAAPVYNCGAMAGTISMSGRHREDEDLAGQGNELAQLAKLISEQLDLEGQRSNKSVYTENKSPISLFA